MSGLDLLIPQSALWYMLLVAVLAGACLGVICDGLFILRLIFRDPEIKKTPASVSMPDCRPARRLRVVLHAVLRGFCDAVLVLTGFVILMLLCYYTSDGQLRAPAIFGMSAGFWGYHKTVSRLVRRFMALCLGGMERFLCFVWSHTLGHVLHAWIRTWTAYRRNAATERRIRELTRDAAHGFGLADEEKT